jgi:Cytochrome c552/Cytochrome c554 and c-prime
MKPSAAESNNRMATWTTTTFVISCLAVSVASGLTFLGRQPLSSEEAAIDRPNQIAHDGYASSSRCQSCHPSEYSSWRNSYHRTMTQVATPDSVIADFDGTVVNGVPGQPMQLERRGLEFWAHFDDPDSEGPGPKTHITRQVVMVTGSHHQQVYWYPTGIGRMLGQLRAEFLVAERRWIPRSSALMHPPLPATSETGSWNATCIACHATDGSPGFSNPLGSQPIRTQHADTHAVEFGVACETCHGPGSSHALVNRNPLRRYALHLTSGADPTIVQPERLDTRRSSEVCGQCHAVWEFYDEQSEREANRHGLPYRPGKQLTDTRFIAQPTKNIDSSTMKEILASDPRFVRDTFWSDGMVRVSGREYNGLIESPCFTHATNDVGRLSCFSCHSMHKKPDDARTDKVWAEYQLAPRMETNEACLQCHGSLRQSLPLHSHHTDGSSGSLCYNCHMPYTTFGLLKTLRSHQISSPSVKESASVGRPNACNLCHLDKTLQWTSARLQSWYGTTQMTLGEEDRSVAASVLWLLKGDAGQRAIVAQSMGWSAAQAASNPSWMAPYLAQLLDDQYEAVRFVAARSIQTLPGFTAFEYDFAGPRRQRGDAVPRAIELWKRGLVADGSPFDEALLFGDNNQPRVDVWTRLIRERNLQPVFLRE